MSEKLKKYIHEIEHLKYSDRQPIHASLYENKAMLSKIAWDIHSYNAKKYYKKVNSDHNSTLEKYGYLTGVLNKDDTKLLKEIYASCKKIALNPLEFDSDYVYEPRENLHEDMIRINNYYEPSDFFFNNFNTILNPLKKILERENQFYWKVASCRIFEVKPNKRTQGFHKDDQSPAIKKMFFYPNGANKKNGSTTLRDKFNNEIIIDLEPGSWLIFSNSLCEHQAYSSESASNRATIEIDIMPDFTTDMTLNYSGINSWYPWFPISDSVYNINDELNYKDVYNRNIKRIFGLCSLNKTNSYKFPCELDDFYDESSDIFKSNDVHDNDMNFKDIDNKDEKNINKNNSNTLDDIETGINDIANKKGLLIFLYYFIKIVPLLIVKKIIKRIR